MRLLALVSGLVALNGAGCFDPALDGVACGPGGECPPGYSCDQGQCTKTGGGGIDAGGDATTDGPASDDAGMYPSCTEPLPCPSSSAGLATVCGTVIDLGGNTVIENAGAAAPCDPDQVGAGPCGVGLTLYDALEYVQNPAGAEPILPASLTIDSCGRFVAHDIEPPGLGYLGIVLDDHAMAPGDAWRPTGVVVALSANDVVDNLRVYGVTPATDEGWTMSAGQPFGGPTFVDTGVYISIFVDPPSGRASGVTITVAGAVQPDADFYFSDSGDTAFTVDPTLDATGANGIGLLVNTSLMEHGGTGGEIEGCAWGEDLADSVPGVAFVAEVEPECT